jgi:integrase
MEMTYKKYDPRIAARKVVSRHVKLGESRHKTKGTKQQIITSVGTARNHADALTVFAKWLLRKGKTLKNFNELDIAEYMTERALTTSQSTCDLARQAINMNLLFEDPIDFVASVVETRLTNRAYHPKQIDELITTADADLALSIEVAVSGGLRCMELDTISELHVQLNVSDIDVHHFGTSEAKRGWKTNRFIGREPSERFVVAGKGGLHREVRIEPRVSVLMRAKRRDKMKIVVDRTLNHKSFFELIAGNNFSQQFCRHSNKILGFSHGAHGLRHSFAKRRIRELLCLGIPFEEAIMILSNELGHFASKNTFVYLRD